MTVLLLIALLVNSLTSYVHHGGQYHGEDRFRHSDPLALEAYRVGRHRAPHRAIRLFVHVVPEHGDPWIEVGVLDVLTSCGYTIRVYHSILPGYFNVTPMKRHCPR